MIVSLLEIISGIIQEYIFMIHNYCRSFMPMSVPNSWQNGERGDVILIQGFNERLFTFKKIGNFVNALGYKVYHIKKLDRNFITLAEGVKIIKQFILENNLEEVVLLSHSKGGLIGKYLIDDTEVNTYIKCSISIATPYHGSILGRLRWLSLYELMPNALHYKTMHLTTENNYKIFNLYPRIDNHVIPNRNLILKGANNIQIDVIGHSRIMGSEKTFKEIKKIFNLRG